MISLPVATMSQTDTFIQLVFAFAICSMALIICQTSEFSNLEKSVVLGLLFTGNQEISIEAGSRCWTHGDDGKSGRR